MTLPVVTACRTCELGERRDAGTAPRWDNILRTPTWDVVHAENTAIEGWIVLVARRHITCLADLTPDEADDLGPMIRNVSQALANAYRMFEDLPGQFAEHPFHQHVHVQVVPRGPAFTDDLIGPDVFKALGVEDSQRVPEARMNALAKRLAEPLGADYARHTGWSDDSAWPLLSDGSSRSRGRPAPCSLREPLLRR